MHAPTMNFPILSMLIFVPAVGALATMIMSRRRPELVRLTALVFSSATAALSIWLMVAFQRGEAGFQFTSKHTWISGWGISWHLGVDGISLFLVVMTGVLTPLCLAGIDPHHNHRAFATWMLILQAACIGCFLSLDLFLFFGFFELVLIPMYFLIAGWGYENRIYAAMKFFLFTATGSAFMLVGIITTAVLGKAGPGGSISFDLVDIAENANFAASTGRWLFFAFAIAFAIKVPMFPVHTWLPDAHTQAPTSGSVILAAVLLKMGTYGLLRFGVYLFPEAAQWAAPLFLTLGTIGVLYGAVGAAMQKDLKRVIAYSSVAHLGFIVVGTFAITTEAGTGAVLQNINHGFSTGALFILVGMIYERRKTRQIPELGGIQSVAPLFAGVYMFMMLSSVGLPGLNGFVGEYLILIGSFPTARWWVVASTAGVILAAVYLLWSYQRVFQGPVNEENRTFRELRFREFALFAPFIAVILFIGIYPKPLLERIEPSVRAVVAHVEDRTGYTEPRRPVVVAPDAASTDAAAADAAAADGAAAGVGTIEEGQK